MLILLYDHKGLKLIEIVVILTIKGTGEAIGLLLAFSNFVLSALNKLSMNTIDF